MKKLGSNLKSFPYTICLDYSTFDALNNAWFRWYFDREFFKRMERRGLLDLNEASEVANMVANTEVRVESGGECHIFAHIIGTTYSGHPTATSLCNTLRNLIYHLVAYV